MPSSATIPQLLHYVNEMRKAQLWFERYGGAQAKEKKRRLERKVDELLKELKQTNAIQLTLE